MELFSWEAIDKAIELNIKPMVSEILIYGPSANASEIIIEPIIPKNKSDLKQIIKEKKIEYIGTGLYLLWKNKDFFRELKEDGYKTCVWIPSGEEFEKYVWNNEMDFCYGMYADNFDLLDSLLNNVISKK
jgi:hypothetical protein